MERLITLLSNKRTSSPSIDDFPRPLHYFRRMYESFVSLAKRQISVLYIQENSLNVTECDIVVDLLRNQFAKTTKVYCIEILD